MSVSPSVLTESWCEASTMMDWSCFKEKLPLPDSKKGTVGIPSHRAADLLVMGSIQVRAISYSTEVEAMCSRAKLRTMSSFLIIERRLEGNKVIIIAFREDITSD
jgi:hypothetical protein